MDFPKSSHDGRAPKQLPFSQVVVSQKFGKAFLPETITLMSVRYIQPRMSLHRLPVTKRNLPLLRCLYKLLVTSEHIHLCVSNPWSKGPGLGKADKPAGEASWERCSRGCHNPRLGIALSPVALLIPVLGLSSKNGGVKRHIWIRSSTTVGRTGTGIQHRE